MRTLALGQQFDALLAWDSFFHLTRDAQRAMFARFAAHARVHAPLMFTSGNHDGEAIGQFEGRRSITPVWRRKRIAGSWKPTVLHY